MPPKNNHHKVYFPKGTDENLRVSFLFCGEGWGGGQCCEAVSICSIIKNPCQKTVR